MSVITDVQRDLNLDEVITYVQNKENASNKLDKPNGGDVFLCKNTKDGKHYLLWKKITCAGKHRRSRIENDYCGGLVVLGIRGSGDLYGLA